MSAFKQTGSIGMDELRSHWGLGNGLVTASNLLGITAGIAVTGPMELRSFYGKRNLNITSTTLATNIGAGGMAPWGGSFSDPSAQWLWRDANYLSADALYTLFQINYTNRTTSDQSGTLYYLGDNYTYASHNKVALNGGSTYTGGLPNWSTPASAAVTIPPGKNLFEFVVRNEGAGNPAGLIFFMSVGGSWVMRSDNVNTLLPNCTRTYVGGTSASVISITG